MLPAWSTTSVGPSPSASVAARASASTRPCRSTGTAVGSPRPRNRRGRSTDGCRSAPTSTRTGGSPASPDRTSYPARWSTVSRPAVRQVKFAIVPPVTKPTALSVGSPSRSRTQRPATSSTAAAAGVSARRPVFWSHADVSQSAPSAAGSAPPITIPKNRPEGIATRPGSQASASRSTTSAAERRAVGQVAQAPDHLVGVDRRRDRPSSSDASQATAVVHGAVQRGASVLSSHAQHGPRDRPARRQPPPAAGRHSRRDEVCPVPPPTAGPAGADGGPGGARWSRGRSATSATAATGAAAGVPATPSASGSSRPTEQSQPLGLRPRYVVQRTAAIELKSALPRRRSHGLRAAPLPGRLLRHGPDRRVGRARRDRARTRCSGGSTGLRSRSAEPASSSSRSTS